MAFEFRLPDIGEGVVEGEVVKWLVKAGDAVREDQPMVEVMTDKATVEIPSPKSGTIREIRAPEGELCAVGAVMVVIDESGASAEPRTATEERQFEKKTPAPHEATVIALPHHAPGHNGSADAGKVLAAPATRKLARDLGVDLSRVRPTGPNGRVTHDDVRAAANAPATHATHTPAHTPHDALSGVAVPTGHTQSAAARVDDTRAGSARWGEARRASPDEGGREGPPLNDERIPFRGVRKKIAENMHRSRQTAAHFTYVEECDVTELVALRKRARARAEERGIKLSFLPFIVKAVCAGLKKFPIVNATLDEAKQEIVLRKRYHIGVAAATEDGLVVPVVRDADQRSLFNLAEALETLGEKVRQGKASRDEITGSTFTVSSLGTLGGLLATPIINFPEVAVLGVHKIKPTPVVREGQIVVREMMNLSISLDHRIVDGYEGAQFLQHVIALLQDPTLMFMEMV